VSPGARLATFGVALVATFGVGAAVGTAVGPWDGGDPPAHHDADVPSTGSPATGAHDGHGTAPTTTPATDAHDGD